MTDPFTNSQLIAGLAVIGYVAAAALVLKWIERHTATLADDDPRGLSDDERDELRVLRGEE